MRTFGAKALLTCGADLRLCICTARLKLEAGKFGRALLHVCRVPWSLMYLCPHRLTFSIVGGGLTWLSSGWPFVNGTHRHFPRTSNIALANTRWQLSLADASVQPLLSEGLMGPIQAECRKFLEQRFWCCGCYTAHAASKLHNRFPLITNVAPLI